MQERGEEREPHPYGVDEGATLWSGSHEPHWAGRAPRGMKVWLDRPPDKQRGILYYYVRVEEPVEMRGEHVWLAKAPNTTGWLH